MSDSYTSALAEELAPDVLDRFLRYVRIDTQSRRDRESSPSTPGQLELGRLLVDELQQAGLADAQLDQNGYVVATLPGNRGSEGEAIGLIAHMDTSTDAPGHGVEPIVHRSYDGGVLALPRDGTVLEPAAMPELLSKAGHDIVTGSGDTLLGADDKAGVAEIMAGIAHLAAHPELPRPTLRIAFTPDEEIGEGATLFDIERFGARCAYTLDGSELGELQDETFSAFEVLLTVRGVDVHPGQATGKLVNALRLAARIVAALPADTLTPETTSGREGFIHPTQLTGTPGIATVRWIVRDFDDERLDRHLALLERTAREIVAAEPRARLEVERARAVPQHAQRAQSGARGDRRGRGGDPRRGNRADSPADPRRDRRLAPERDGPPHAEHLHRRTRVPLGARVGFRAGHGGRRGGRRAPGGSVVA